MKLLQKLFLLLIVAVLVVPVFSEEGTDSGFNFQMDMELGAVTINENNQAVAYQMLSLNPDFAFGKVGIGLDFTLHYRFDDGNGNFDFREQDWIPDSKRSFWDIYLPIFRYVRYGRKGDSLYGKIGSIDDGTLGNGFIMGSYSNSHFLPERRIVGLALDLDGSLFNFPYLGIETFAGNLAQMDVFGTRLYVRPLNSLDIPIIKDLQIGTTAAFDRKPNAINDFILTAVDNPDPVSIYGIDFKQPILSNSALSLAVFGDIAFQPAAGTKTTASSGSLLGFGGKLFSFVNYGLNALFLGDNFLPFYFDSAYDLFRENKYAVYSGAANIKGYAGWLANLGFSFMNDMLVFNTSVNGAFNKQVGNVETYPHLRAVVIVAEDLIPGFFFDASYDKRYIENWADLIDPNNAVIGLNINYKTGPAVITLGYNLRYIPETGQFDTTSKLSTSISLF